MLPNKLESSLSRSGFISPVIPSTSSGQALSPSIVMLSETKHLRINSAKDLRNKIPHYVQNDNKKTLNARTHETSSKNSSVLRNFDEGGSDLGHSVMLSETKHLRINSAKDLRNKILHCVVSPFGERLAKEIYQHRRGQNDNKKTLNSRTYETASKTVSVFIAVYNEEKYIEGCLNSVSSFEMPEGFTLEAILVLDGGSRDKTVSIVQRLAKRDKRIKILDNPGRIQSCAMNRGLQAVQSEWILWIGAHAEYPSNYLKLCLETALRTKADNVGGLFITLPGGKSYSAKLVQALTTHLFGVGDAGYRIGQGEGYADTVWGGCFRRELFERIGLFDERLVRAQDYEMNRRIIASGGKIWRNPSIRVFYHHQPTLFAFYRKQMLREAPYNAYMWFLAPYAFKLRHAITGFFALGVLGGLMLSPLSVWIWFLFFAVMSLYFILSILSAIQQAVRYRDGRHIVCLPICFFFYHFLHGLGVLGGLVRLAAGTAPIQKVKEPWPGAGRFRAWPMVSDKTREKNRYDLRAVKTLQSNSIEGEVGAKAMPVTLRKPYEVYESRIHEVCKPGTYVLDLCCGTGLYSFQPAELKAQVVGLDISHPSLETALRRSKRLGLTLVPVCGDAETLPFNEDSFDVITSAGSFSYAASTSLLAEIKRVLRKEGHFVLVDSFNHNPLYVLNRFFHYLRGNRSWDVIRRIPDRRTIQRIKKMLGSVSVSYHGVLSFLAPLLTRLAGEKRAANWLNAFDEKLPWLGFLAFKIVLVAKKEKD